MTLPDNLTQRGFSLQKAAPEDFNSYFAIVKTCFLAYINEYFGGWVEDTQLRMNTEQFNKMLQKSCFKKILLNGQTVGFFAFDEQSENIVELAIQLTPPAQNQGVGSFFLQTVTALSDQTGKPARLRVFKSNPAQNLYIRFGFTVTGETRSHFLMEYEPQQRRESGC